MPQLQVFYFFLVVLELIQLLLDVVQPADGAGVLRKIGSNATPN